MSASVPGSGKMKQGIIVYVEDSAEDQLFFEMALKEAQIENKLIMFNDGAEALAFLKKTEELSFIIVSDVNMPKMDGFKLKEEIEADESLRLKAIPFIFLSTSAARQDVKTAFYHQAQGYFEKPSDIGGLVRILKLIAEYWSVSELPALY
jgi:CheY-like chemotaxis protein